MNNILERIKQVIADKNLSHEYLANKMAISRSYVSMLLSGDRVLNKDLIIKFSEALSISLEELLNSTVDAEEDYVIRTRGEFKSRLARSKIANVKIQMDDYIRLKGIYENEQFISK